MVEVVRYEDTLMRSEYVLVVGIADEFEGENRKRRDRVVFDIAFVFQDVKTV